VKVVKNKIAAPFREAEVDILYGRGICRESDVLDLGVVQGVVEKSGSWYSYKGERIGQGRDTARQLLIDQPELCQRIEAELRKSLGFGGEIPKKEAEFELNVQTGVKKAAV
jgi:recombination protein RecA